MLDNNCTPLTKCLNIKSLFSQEFNKCKNCNLFSFPGNNDKISGAHQGGISLSVPSPGSYNACTELQPAVAAQQPCLVAVKGQQRRVRWRLSLLVHLWWSPNAASCSHTHQPWLSLTPLLLCPALSAFPWQQVWVAAWGASWAAGWHLSPLAVNTLQFVELCMEVRVPS